MKQQYNFRQIKSYLQKQPPIHFKGLTKEQVGNKLTDFLKNFFIYNSKYDTVFDNGKVQCAANLRRSIGDIYRIVYYYFPKIMLKSVYGAMITNIAEGRALSAICHATHMRIYRGTKEGYDKPFINGALTDEFTVDLTQFENIEKCKHDKIGWNMNDPETLLNIVQL